MAVAEFRRGLRERFFRMQPTVVIPETTGERTPERQFVDIIDSAIYSLKKSDLRVERQHEGRRMHFNQFDFGERVVEERIEHFFEETVSRDKDGYPIAPYIDAYETQKGVLRHTKRMLLVPGNKPVALSDGDQEDISHISEKLDGIVNMFGHK